RVKGVLLGRKGDNKVSLSVANAEDRSDTSSFTVRYDQPSPPEVTLLEPARDGTTPEREVPVRFRIRSDTPPRGVTLVREGEGRWSKTVDASRLRREGDVYLSEPLLVPLAAAVNPIP